MDEEISNSNNSGGERGGGRGGGGWRGGWRGGFSAGQRFGQPQGPEYCAPESRAAAAVSDHAPVQRQLMLVVSEDMPRLREEMERRLPGSVARLEGDTRSVEWQLDGRPWGFRTRITSADAQLLDSLLGTRHADSGDQPFDVFGEDGALVWIMEGRGGTVPGAQSVALADSLQPQPRPSRATICIASGENELFTEVRTLMQSLYPAQPDVVRMQRLNCGDVAWTRDGQQFGLLVERKEANDLVASTKDERTLQLQRMLDCAPTPGQVVYVVVGDVHATRSAMDWKAKTAAITYKPIRHGVRVVTAETTRATAQLIARMHLQLERADEAKLHEKRMFFGNALNAAPKKQDYVDDGGQGELLRLLTTVHGVSDDRAAALAAHFGTFAAMMKVLLATAREGGERGAVQMLGAVQVGGGKRLGPAVAQRIVSRFAVAELAGVSAAAAPAPAPARQRVIDVEEDWDDDDDDDDDGKGRAGRAGVRIEDEFEEYEVPADRFEAEVKGLGVDAAALQSGSSKNKFYKNGPSLIKPPTKKRAAPVFAKAKAAAATAKKRASAAAKAGESKHWTGAVVGKPQGGKSAPVAASAPAASSITRK